MSAEDLVRIRHMVEAAREALAFAEGRSREDLFENRMLFHSLVRNIEIIGEAASKVSPAMRRSRPEFPWPDVIGMRNRLVHGYFDIDPDIVWDTATHLRGHRNPDCIVDRSQRTRRIDDPRPPLAGA